MEITPGLAEEVELVVATFESTHESVQICRARFMERVAEKA
jgi:hypothetical protein